MTFLGCLNASTPIMFLKVQSHTTHSFVNVYYLATSFDPSIGNRHVLLHWPVDDLYGRLKLVTNIRKRVSYV